MALFPLTRILRKTTNHSQLVLPLLLQISTHSSSLSTPKLFSFTSAFHHTLSKQSRLSHFTSHFSTLQSFPTRTLTDPFPFSPPSTYTRDPREQILLDSVKQVAHFDSETQAIASLDEAGVEADVNLVYSVIWALREEWRLAFLAFKLGERQGSLDEKVCELMVWVLGNCKKFNIAWCLIRDMYKSSFSTRCAMLVMIDRYVAANDPCKAIRTFRIMEKFRITPDEEAFLFLLNALCQHGNVEEAEEFMLGNKKMFPLAANGFNIILNGWCNIFVDVFESKRVWREMSNYCIMPNATSYAHMISCFSKVGNLFDSLRLYDEMKKRGWVPDLEVYNSLIFVLTRENCFKEALKMLDKMKASGLQPDSATYDSMILPLCDEGKLEDARNILATMTGENLSPSSGTYHAFLKCAGFEGTLEILGQMRIAGLGPNRDTFLLILHKFFKLEQPENALRIWVEMKKYEVDADSTHYTVLVEGLASCGLPIKAREFYAEMRSNGYLDDPKLKKLVNKLKDNRHKRQQQVRKVKRNKPVGLWTGSATQQEKSRKQSRKRKNEESDSKL